MGKWGAGAVENSDRHAESDPAYMPPTTYFVNAEPASLSEAG